MIAGGLLYKETPVFTEFDASSVLADLNIDEIIENIANASDKPYLKEYYAQKPSNPNDLYYRLAIMRDLADPKLYEGIIAFVRKYGLYKRYDNFSKTLSQKEVKEKWHHDAAKMYCESLIELQEALKNAGYSSEGFRRFYNNLSDYLKSEKFKSLHEDMRICTKQVNEVSYELDVRLSEGAVYVDRDCGDTDYFEDLQRVFSRYNCETFHTTIPAFADLNMCSLELDILGYLKRIYPDALVSLQSFYAAHGAYGNELFDTFEREIHFYLSYIRYMEGMKQSGFAFAFPRFIGEKQIRLTGGYDLALAQSEKRLVIPNDFEMNGEDNHFILTGPNQGGKTTFARMLGQNIYFAMIGLPAPCEALELCFFDGLYTHFIKKEVLGTNLGRLKEELSRLRLLIDSRPQNGFVIINELFSSAASYDAMLMGGDILKKLESSGCRSVYVTHIFELANGDPGIISLVAGVDAENSRTYKITRKCPEGIAYSNHLLDKYHLYKKNIGVRINDSFNTL